MKRCPQCNKVFEDDKGFCTEDGTPLLQETFSLPSNYASEDKDDDEQETVLRYKPVDIDLSKPKTSDSQVPTAQPQVNQYAPNHNTAPPLTADKPNRGCLKYVMILLVGSIIGGGLVLAGLGIGYVYLNSPTNENGNVNKESIVEKSPTEKTNANSNKNPIINHSEKNSSINQSKLNGRVIKSSVSLRNSPNSKAKRIVRLPKNDRLEIIRRKSSTSKWYEVECEHGVKGWIDGYSIEFTQ